MPKRLIHRESSRKGFVSGPLVFVLRDRVQLFVQSSQLDTGELEGTSYSPDEAVPLLRFEMEGDHTASDHLLQSIEIQQLGPGSCCMAHRI